MNSRVRRIALGVGLAAAFLFVAASVAQAQGGSVRPAPSLADPLPELRLLPQDQLLVKLLGEEDFSGTYVVRDDGRILLPIVGEVAVGGKTLAEAAAVILEALRGPYVHPQLSVELTKPTPRRVYIAGEVLRPQILEWREANSLSKALNLAGGVDPERGDLRHVKLKRGARESTIDITDFVRQGDFSMDVRLEPEDQVLVPQRPRCTLLGPLTRGGEVFFDEGDTLYQILSREGILRTARTFTSTVEENSINLRCIRVIRDEQAILVNLEPMRQTGDPTSDIVMERSDRVIIPDRGQIFVTGHVNRPGPVDTRDARTAGRAVVGAGGWTADAALDITVVIHEGVARTVDLAAALLQGDPSQDTAVEQGDLVVVPDNQIQVLGAVAQSGRFGLKWGCRLTEALSAAGGPSLAADLRNVTIVRDTQVTRVDMLDTYRSGRVYENPPLKPFDVVVVPEAWVYLTGEVAKSGQVPYRQATSVAELLSTVGGVTQNARIDSAYLLRSGETRQIDLTPLLRKGNVAADIPLEPNDRVVIPELLDQRVYVIGQVSTPRALRVEEAPDIAKAIALCGGTLQKNADLPNAKVLRGDQVIPVDLHALYVENDRSQNVALQPGDTVVIPENEQGYVFVLGLVNRPGPVNHFKGLRLSQALATAGGQVLDANIREIRIVRGAGVDRKIFRVDFRALFNAPADEKEKEMRTPPRSGGRLVRIPEVPEAESERAERSAEEARVEEISGDPVLERGDVILVLEESSSKSRRTLLPWISSIGNLLSYYLGRTLIP